MCIFSTAFYSTTFVWNNPHSNKNSARYYHKRSWVFMQSICYSCRISKNWNFLHRFSKNPQIWNFTKIYPVGAELFHANRWIEGQTDRTKLTVAYHNFVNAPYTNTIHTGTTAFNAWQSPPKLWGNKVLLLHLTTPSHLLNIILTAIDTAVSLLLLP